jgi:predicted transcriptional regulator
MKARDVMVSPVITVGENETVRDLAKLLIAKRISAAPVVNDSGKVIGIVTEPDLLHRAEAGTERLVSWWLSLISGDRALADATSKRSIPTRPLLKLPIFSRSSISSESRS